MSCDKIKHKCGKEVFAVCTKYQGTVSENSELFEEECLDVQEVIEDLYTMIDDIKEEIDMSELDNECLTIAENSKVKDVIQLLITTICQQQEQIQSQQELIETIQGQITDLQENNCG